MYKIILCHQVLIYLIIIGTSILHNENKTFRKIFKTGLIMTEYII